MHKTLLLMLLGFSSLLLKAQNYMANAEVVKTFSSPIQSLNLQPAGNKLLIYAQVNSSLCELWSSDGTTNTMLSNAFGNYDIQRGYTGWNGLAEINGKYFVRPALKTAFGSVLETEPLLTDGITVTQLADLYPNTSTNAYSSEPCNFTKFDNKVYFSATTAAGPRVFYFTGTGQPTAITGLTVLSEAVAFNNNTSLLLSGYNTVSSSARGLYRLDAGSTTPTLISTFENIYSLQTLGNKVIFWGKKTLTDAIGYELYMTDGTAAGTVLLKDIVAGSQSPVIHSNESYMVTTTGKENNFVVLNTTPVTAYFQYRDPVNSQYYIGQTDGTPSGTVSIFSSSQPIQSPCRAGNKVAFLAYDPVSTGYITRVTDGTTAPAMLLSGNKGYNITIGGVEGGYTYDAAGNFISSIYDPVTGAGTLIITNGTSAGTKSVKVTYPQTAYITDADDFTVIGNYLYFVNGYSVYRINLTTITLATTPVTDIAARAAGLTVYPNPVMNGMISIEGAGTLSRTGEIALYNMAGAKVFGGTVVLHSGKGKVELNALPKGIYTLELQTTQEKRSSLIVIQ
jgi:ELWxxDGT repeat protein